MSGVSSHRHQLHPSLQDTLMSLMRIKTNTEREEKMEGEGEMRGVVGKQSDVQPLAMTKWSNYA